MLPKLKAFYFNAVLPELASPRNNSISGIREPGIWYKDNSLQQSCKSKRKLRKKSTETDTDNSDEDPSVDLPPDKNNNLLFGNKDFLTSKKDESAEKKDPSPSNTTLTNSNQTAGTSASCIATRSRRNIKVKFKGRRISHEWVENEEQGIKKWYSGTVIGILSGKDGDPSAVYEIMYDDDDEPYCVDHLLEDCQASSVKFIDL